MGLIATIKRRRAARESAQSAIDVLKRYQWSEQARNITILHVYPEGIAFPDGYYHGRWFRLIGYDEKERTRVDFGRHDRIIIEAGAEIKYIEIYADRSTLVMFRHPVEVVDGQAAFVYSAS